MPAQLKTAKEIQELFGLPSPSTLRSMRAKGLPAVRLGKAYLFDCSDVEKFIAEQKVAR